MSDRVNDLGSMVKRDLTSLEKSIHNLEQIYLEETHSFGNVIRGWDSNLNYKNTKSSVFSTYKRTKLLDKERLFSLSSVSSITHKKIKSEQAGLEIEESNPEYKSNTQFKKKTKKNQKITIRKISPAETEESLLDSESEVTVNAEPNKKNRGGNTDKQKPDKGNKKKNNSLTRNRKGNKNK